MSSYNKLKDVFHTIAIYFISIRYNNFIYLVKVLYKRFTYVQNIIMLKILHVIV